MRSPRRTPSLRPAASRRGVTLLEMLVTVALLLIMMLTIVSIFQAATGSVTESRARALLDQDLRRIDTLLRQDLAGVTARMTPPNNPADNRGYFEYAENSLSDEQGEDSDDTLRFTAKAPDGRPFTGRVWVPKTVPPTDPDYAGTRANTLEPVPVTSQYAEIIYFQRGDKLYRRVKLILPEFTPQAVGNTESDPNTPPGTRTGTTRIGFATNLFQPFELFQTSASYPAIQKVGTYPFVGWQALNDISAHPRKYPAPKLPADLTLADYVPQTNSLGDLTDRHFRYSSPRFADDFVNNTNSATLVPDGLPDDRDGNGVPDYYPTLYFNSQNAGLTNDFLATADRPSNKDLTAFPFVFPNAFSGGIQSDYGLLHVPDKNTKAADRTFNHNPVPTGDSLPTPISDGFRTWWAFPTWRETAAPTWLDPIKRINDPATADAYLKNEPMVQVAKDNVAYQQTRGLTAVGGPFPLPPQPGEFSDGAGGNLFDLADAPVFEDDLIASNVRSFNVKALDPSPRYYNTTTKKYEYLLPGYYDLGYIAGINPSNGLFDASYANGTNLAATITATDPAVLDCFGHEGRMPPLVEDYRYDAQFPTYVDKTGVPRYANLGDNTTTVTRLRRVWDSWSTTYTNAPALPLNPLQGPYNPNPQLLPAALIPPQGNRAVTPSYPAPYPSALRGIEIQVRITDPEDKRIKTMTVRQDFTEQL